MTETKGFGFPRFFLSHPTLVSSPLKRSKPSGTNVDLDMLMHFGSSECATVRYNLCSSNSCRKKEEGPEKASNVTESKSLLKFKHFFHRQPY